MVSENGFIICMLEAISISSISIAAFILARSALLFLKTRASVQSYVSSHTRTISNSSRQASTMHQDGNPLPRSFIAQLIEMCAPLRLAPFSYVASKLIKRASCGDVCRFVYRMHPALHCFTSAETMLTWLCVAAFVVGVITLVVSGQWLSSFISICAVSVCSYFILKHTYDSDLRRQREAIPQVLELMSDSFSCGFTLLQTFESVCASDNCLVKDVFKRALNVLRLSGDTSRALNVLKSSRLGNHMSFVAVALQIQHMCGASSHGVVQAAMKSAQNELELSRKLSTQTAQAHLSARIVCALPLVLLTLFSIISPGFLDAYFKSISGILIFCTALGMQALGMFLVHRILQIPELR